MSGADTISVLAGGWSVRAIAGELERLPGLVIAVNDSAIYAPRVDIVVSMDRLWTENRWPLLSASPRPTYIRRSAMQNIVERPPWLTVFACNHETEEPSDRQSVLNGTSSGMCALNLALQLRPKRVVMFGFDMCVAEDGSPYWYPAPPWQNGKRSTSDGKYRSWSTQFSPLLLAFFAARIEVVNASRASAIPNFPKVDPRSVLA